MMVLIGTKRVNFQRIMAEIAKFLNVTEMASII